MSIFLVEESKYSPELSFKFVKKLIYCLGESSIILLSILRFPFFFFFFWLHNDNLEKERKKHCSWMFSLIVFSSLFLLWVHDRMKRAGLWKLRHVAYLSAKGYIKCPNSYAFKMDIVTLFRFSLGSICWDLRAVGIVRLGKQLAIVLIFANLGIVHYMCCILNREAIFRNHMKFLTV